MKEVNAPNCGHENDLIAFLYGELNDAEALSFQRHLHNCAACGAELVGFTQVRESVVAWRNESLTGVFQPAESASLAPASPVVKRPSALAAIREFFNLAPLWMKGALAFASILFCVFAGLAIAGSLRDKPPAVIVERSIAPSEEQLNALVQRRVEEELERRKQSSGPLLNPIAVADNAGNRNSPQRNDPVQKARRPLSKTERQELAADLRLLAANESELELLDDGINQ